MRTSSTVEKTIDVPFVLTGKQEGLGLTEIGVCLALKKRAFISFWPPYEGSSALAGVGNGLALKIPWSLVGSQREK